MALTVGYIGATGRDIGFCGTQRRDDRAININQIDPAVARTVFPGPNGDVERGGAARSRSPNPFFGVAGAGEFGDARDHSGRPAAAAVPAVRRRLHVRDDRGRQAPVPRRDVRARQAQRHRTGGAAASATPGASTKDNQFGETSTFQDRTRLPQNNYDLDAEYGISNFDSPHRIILAPIVQFPEPGKSGIAGRSLGGWNASAVVELVSGSPLNAVMSAGASDANLGLFGGRQRPNLVGDPNTDGSDNDRVVSRATRAPATSTAARSPIPGAGTLRQRAAHHRRRALSVPQEHRPGRRQGHDADRQPRRAGAVRDPEPDQHGEVPRHRLATPSIRQQLRPHHAAGRVHADLAAELPLHVLRAGARGPGLGLGSGAT